MKKIRPKTPSLEREAPLVEAGEVFAELAEHKGSSLLLGRYSLNEVVAVLSKRSFLKEARKRFLWPLEFELNSSEYPLQRLQIFFRDKSPDNLIVDFKFKETEFIAAPVLPPQKALAFEWLTLQNPVRRFSESFTPLPGQVRPGLNMSKKIMDLFVYLGRLTHKDCLLAFPAYFHNALLFSRYFRFWNPAKEGEVLAIRRVFSHTPLKQLAWIVHLDCLKREDGSAYEWEAEEQLHPLTRDLRDYFGSRAYRDAVRACQDGCRFSIDWPEFDRRAKANPCLCGGDRILL
jgi:hypothetical protein